MHIYRHELSLSWRSILIWSLSIVALLFVFMALYPGFAADAALLEEAMARFPPELLAAFGMGDANLATVLGYFSFLFVFVQICLAIQAANYGFGLVSVEERELTADFLLTRPVSRNKIITAKLLAALTGLAITNVVVWLTSFAVINLFRNGAEYDAGRLVMLLLSMALLQLFFLSVGMLISQLVKRVRSVTPYTMALVFGLYMLNAFGNMIGRDTFELLSPFRHFEPTHIVNQGRYDPLITLSVAITVVALIGSYVLYARRNIPAPA